MLKRSTPGPEKYPNKRKKENQFVNHPNGVMPLGNLYLSNQHTSLSSRDSGFGSLSIIPDDILLFVLGELEAFDLASASSTSKALFLFSAVDSLWRDIFINTYKGDFQFEDNWKATYIKKAKALEFTPTPLMIEGFYSDVIYNNWYCAQINPYMWAQSNNIDRRQNLSIEEFRAKYENPGVPCVITDIVKDWPAFQNWNEDYLLSNYGDIAFKTDQQVDVKMRDYLRYTGLLRIESESRNGQFVLRLGTDPLDKFCERAPKMTKEYTIPPYFTTDYFSLLNDRRPSFRWLLIGPVRAGATFHKDPNWTNAWNGLISGKKKWIFYPPDVAPLGVIPSPDGLEVTVPSTMVQWFLDFYPQKPPVKPIECIQNPGDLMFIPSGWWHSVINLEPSVAITQNYVDESNLRKVFKFLKSKTSDVLSNQFSEALKEAMPERYEALLEELQITSSAAWEEEVDNGETWSLGF